MSTVMMSPGETSSELVGDMGAPFLATALSERVAAARTEPGSRRAKAVTVPMAHMERQVVLDEFMEMTP
jgi:hypothetical protein